MKIKKLSHLCLSCKDINKIIEFYQNTLNFEVVHQFKNDTGETYGVFLLIGENSFIEFFKSQEEITEGNRYRHFALEVEDITKTALELEKKGINCKVKRGKTDLVLQFTIKDCEGNIIEFQQFDEGCVYRKHLEDRK